MTESMLFELKAISKRFPGVLALDNVDFGLKQDEIHGLVGENGAGKSTLVNIIGGVIVPDSGSISIHGQAVEIKNPGNAHALGIGFIHQELSLFPNMDIASNIFFAELPQRIPGLIDNNRIKQQTRAALDRVGLTEVSPSQKLETLSPGRKQLVEIARCVAQRNEILVLDEPTSSLSGREIQTLFQIVRELKKQGVSIIYVTHHLDEVFEVCDRVTVLRDGKRIDTIATKKVTHVKLVNMILGHEIAASSNREIQKQGKIALRVESISRGLTLKDISFDLHEGEILGITGLLGSGRTELARAIFGLDRIDYGKLWITDKRIHIHNPEDAIRHGIGFITENRRDEGLLVDKSIVDNIVLANLRLFSNKIGWISAKRERLAAEQQKTNLRILTPSINRLAKYLSGGNQQKVVLAKWLQTTPRILILDEPTRGIDVGAKEEVYHLIQKIAAQGTGVIYITSEIAEVVRLCDRVLVMLSGAIVTTMNRGDFTGQDILLAATGGSAL